jgi:aspartyl-tRNA(Asn)/glutamyl-tRNA(Gln) amidotransferase subunit B
MNKHYEVVIGLEVHVQLNTKSKLFCSCATSFGDEANTHTCPVCLALPGALPVMNKEAMRKAVMLGKAINAKINQNSIFARKNYFYPDLPTGYQISQFEIPIVGKGELVIDFEDGTQKTIGVTRAHLEMDAGKNMHDGNHSKVDLNRASTPLLEIVSEPDMRSSEEAILYLKKLHSIVRYLGISNANMQEGSFRVDVNVSVRPKGQKEFGTRCEIKNLNSFRHIAKAIAYEVERHIDAIEDGVYEDEIYLETRLFDVNSGVTKSMRGKEDAADYRYFPDPDLLHLEIDEESMNVEIPELPDEKKERFIKEYKIKEADAIVLTADLEMAHYFEEVVSCGVSGKNAVSYLTSELLGRLKKEAIFDITQSPISAKTLGKVIERVEDSTISGKGAKDLLDLLMKESIEVDKGIEKLGIKQVSDDGAIITIIDEVLSKNSDKVDEYKGGKDKLFGFFVGQVMKASRGSANPAKVNQLLKEKLS